MAQIFVFGFICDLNHEVFIKPIRKVFTQRRLPIDARIVAILPHLIIYSVWTGDISTAAHAAEIIFIGR